MNPPVLRPAPDLALARALSAATGPIHSLDEEPAAARPEPSVAPRELETWLGLDGCRVLADAWDTCARLVRRRVEPIGPITSIEAFAAWATRYPKHVVEIVRGDGDEVRFPPMQAFRAEVSSRAELLGLRGTPEAWAPLGALEQWTGSVWKDFWFYTPPHTSSLPVHVDEQNNLVIQVSGTKHWTLYPQRRPRPVFGFGKHALTASDLAGAEPRTVTLEPGDVLLLPRGVPHRAETTNEASLHLDVNLVLPSAVHDMLLGAWWLLDPSWSGDATTRLWPLDRPRDAARTAPQLPVVEPDERRFWWRATIEADFERRAKIGDPSVATRLRLGLGESLALYRTPMAALRRGTRRYAHARGWILEFDAEFEPTLAMLARGVSLGKYEDMRRCHRLEIEAVERAGWITCQ